MSKPILIRPRASQDIDDTFDYLAQNDMDTALRFFDAVRLTLAQLGKMPGIGVVFPSSNSRLLNLRKWPIKGFKRYLVFYFDQTDRIAVVRISQTSRDITSILEDYELRLGFAPEEPTHQSIGVGGMRSSRPTHPFPCVLTGETYRDCEGFALLKLYRYLCQAKD